MNQKKILVKNLRVSSVAEPDHFYAALAPGTNFDAGPATGTILL
jgi:hypothetical protein